MQCYCIATDDLGYPDIGCKVVVTAHISGVDKNTFASEYE